ncbi:MAG: two-component system, sensor histidine kinase PdtaS [Frankiales bacterium]|jgi:two-component sensor histidine kinase|nr:two-component system, sensor histidine kinase PdtaS [Frankiales bacterium]
MLRRYTDLDTVDVDRLQALVADWQLLADLSFADLVLHAPLRSGHPDAPGFVIVAQMRPATGPTSLVDDLVGRISRAGQRPLVDAAYAEDRIVREGDPVWHEDVPVREEAIPVGGRRNPIGVVARHTNLAAARAPSRLELAYLSSADELAQMVQEGSFPFPGEMATPEATLRVGDGLIRLEADGRVSYASPNALSAWRRLGLTADLTDAHLGTVTAALVRTREPVDEAVASVVSGRAPRVGEIEGNGAVLRLRAIPLTLGQNRIGALVLVRDVTELRVLDRQLLTKDATIREIHHRVKNNLQTVAALLRLQARRLELPEARFALEEAVRRVGSIALVHETLALTLDEAVAFDDIADRVITMVGEVAGAGPGDDPGSDIAVSRRGSFGLLAAEVATPLAMVLTELVQNAVEHGLAGRGGQVEVDVRRSAVDLVVTVADDGRGLPEGFSSDGSSRLGLRIVRTLVLSELGGQLDMRPRTGGGTEVVVALPLPGSSPTE